MLRTSSGFLLTLHGAWPSQTWPSHLQSCVDRFVEVPLFKGQATWKGNHRSLLRYFTQLQTAVHVVPWARHSKLDLGRACAVRVGCVLRKQLLDERNVLGLLCATSTLLVPASQDLLQLVDTHLLEVRLREVDLLLVLECAYLRVKLLQLLADLLSRHAPGDRLGELVDDVCGARRQSTDVVALQQDRG